MNEDLALKMLIGGRITAAEYIELTGKQPPTRTMAQFSGGSAGAQGDNSIAAAQKAIVIKGDNNHVNTILAQARTEMSEDELRREIEQYLNWVVAQNRTITLRGIKRQGHNVIELDLDTVFVPLAAAVRRDTADLDEKEWGRVKRKDKEMLRQMGEAFEKGQAKEIELNDVLRQGERLIITGGPGCGKTTVLNHMAWVLAESLGRGTPKLAAEKLGLNIKDEPLPLPVFIPINRFAYHLRKHEHGTAEERTLAHFVSTYLIERQTSLNLPPDFLRQLLKQGKRLVLLLDGLDEVPNEAERAQVRQAIEDLVAGHPDLRVLVTCRTAAYNGRVALGHRFREIEVLDLDQTHLSNLIGQAYQAVYPHNIDEQQRLSKDLLVGIEQMERDRQRRLGDNAQRLVTSPLLVRMFLIVHLSERRLPQQRAELYSKATDNMIEPDYAADETVRDEIGQLVGNRLKQLELLQHLAFQMHHQGEAGRDIDEPDLKRVLRQRPESADLIAPFIAVTRQRGTLMEERLGTYRFIHLGFQEFLVARHMVEALWFEQEFDTFLCESKALQDSWWREPLLLLAGHLSLTFERQAEKYIRYLAGLEGGQLTQLSTADRWAAAELAGTAVTEWPTIRPEVKTAVVRALVNLIKTAANDPIPAPIRAGLGRVLGLLGDPRPGVGLTDRGLPDIVWGKPVPAGTYTIGHESEHEDEAIQPAVIDQAYQLAIYPITQAQFQTFLDAGGDKNGRWWHDLPDDEPERLRSPFFTGNNLPRENVSWYQAVAFCRWLSDQLGYEVRLPTDFEWEVAARFNDGRAYPYGDQFDENCGSTDENGFDETVAVGLYENGRQPQLDLYDMSGNVWEWCLNKFEDPMFTAVDTSGNRRVLRGGSWGSNQNFARAAFRGDSDPDDRGYLLGFRVCRASPPISS